MFRLAALLGMTVRRLEHELGSDELTEWQGYERLEPWGFVIDCYRAGVIASTMVNTQRSPNSAKPPMLPFDLFPVGIIKDRADEIAAAADARQPTPEEIARNVREYINRASLGAS